MEGVRGGGRERERVRESETQREGGGERGGGVRESKMRILIN